MEQNSEEKTRERILAFMDLAGKDILEIGCGDGRLTEWLARETTALTAIDPDEKRVALARRKVQGAEVAVGSGEALGFQDASFDIILFSLSLHHQDSRLALKEAWRVLRDGGSLLVLEPLNDGGMGQIFTLLHNEDREKEAVRQAIKESDWVVRRCESFESRWVFEGPDELFEWAFGNYSMPFDAALAKQMAEHPDVDLDARPLSLTEVQELLLLQKPA
ncbi:class I SAM-dependent methyltransferase [Desulfoluna spongiiphila]|uniref:Methyltransferase domain-containing protein n=1 Tax=Desulfoluna spongiiphila TaxID=419481 RepID=A0A1G5FXT7_9BACT|nr:class I SAM-dependent methyltransferase [Desulfoluna spongiiphila]SCY44076.1 Methyltransferase domain-containing protein [Desulfoluna spongiiphila]VVS91404.1 s-adenosyl-l-methionine-dependent methyltransferase [Desulfoluna spongiiphila]